MSRPLSTGALVAIIILVILLLVAIALAIYFGVKSSQNATNSTGFTNFTGVTGPTGPTGPTGASGSFAGFTLGFAFTYPISLPNMAIGQPPVTITTTLPYTPGTNTVTVFTMNLPGYNGQISWAIPPLGTLGGSYPVQYEAYIAGSTLTIRIYPMIAGGPTPPPQFTSALLNIRTFG